MSLVVASGKLFWVDPNSGPITDTQILEGSISGDSAPTAIYTGSLVRQPVIDGSGLSTDGRLLYAADEVEGRIFALDPINGRLDYIGSRYSGSFDTERANYIASSGGVVYIADTGRGRFEPVVVSTNPLGERSHRKFNVLHSGWPFGQLTGISVFKDYVFITDKGTEIDHKHQFGSIWELSASGLFPLRWIRDPRLQCPQALTVAIESLYVVDQGSRCEGPVSIYRVDIGSAKNFDGKLGPDASVSLGLHRHRLLAPVVLEKLARQTFDRHLSASERSVLRGAESGEPIWLGSPDEKASQEYDKNSFSSWGAAHCIRSALLHWLAANPEATKLVSTRGIEIANARIVGPRDPVSPSCQSAAYDDGGLDFSDVHVNFPFHCEHCFIPGGIWVSGAQTRSLSFSHSYIGPVSASGIVVHGILVFEDSRVGPIDLRYGDIEGDIYCSSRLANDWDINPYGSREAIPPPIFNGREVAVAGNASFSMGFEPDGQVVLSGARVGGDLDVSFADFSYSPAHPSSGYGSGLILSNARIAGDFVFRGVSLNQGSDLDLESLSVDGSVDLDASSWPSNPTEIRLDRFGYPAVNLYKGVFRMNAQDRREALLTLLATQPSLQPYVAAANALRVDGDVQGSELLLEAKETERYRKMGLIFSIWGGFYRWTTHYGSDPFLAVRWSILIIFVGTMIFWWADVKNLFVAVEDKESKKSWLSERFSPITYSVDTFFPLIPLEQSTRWRPKGDSKWGKVLRAYLWIHVLLGIIMVSMFAAGMAVYLHGS